MIQINILWKDILVVSYIAQYGFGVSVKYTTDIYLTTLSNFKVKFVPNQVHGILEEKVPSSFCSCQTFSAL